MPAKLEQTELESQESNSRPVLSAVQFCDKENSLVDPEQISGNGADFVDLGP